MGSNVKPFGIKDKLGYMFGDIANDFSFIFASTYVMVFYSKVMGISTTLIGTLFLVARCIDAFTDIGMGRIVDRSKGNDRGRIKPWLIRMCGPVAIASFLMYQAGLANADYTVKVIYMFVTYILWGSIFYTSINIPYGSLASVISNDPKDRSSLSVFRSLGGALAGILIMAIAPQIVYTTDAAGNQVVVGSRVTMIAGVFSVCAIVCYIICYALCTERVKIEPKVKSEHGSVAKTLGQLFSSRALLGVIISAVLLLLATLMSQGINNFLFADYFKNTNALSLMSMLQLPVMIILAMCSTKLAVRFGKKECGVVGMGFSAIIYLLVGFLKIKNVYTFIGFIFVGMLGMYFFMMQCYALVGDVIDDNEVKTGKRDDGTVYGIYSFSRKIGQAIAGGLSGWALSWIGYDELAAGQTQEVADGIYYLSTVFPGIIYLLCALVLAFIYPLSKARTQANVAELERRREQS